MFTSLHYRSTPYTAVHMIRVLVLVHEIQRTSAAVQVKYQENPYRASEVLLYLRSPAVLQGCQCVYEVPPCPTSNTYHTHTRILVPGTDILATLFPTRCIEMVVSFFLFSLKKHGMFWTSEFCRYSCMYSSTAVW